MTNTDSSISQVSSTKYVLSAIDTNGNRVFYAIDQRSGGYPYWSTMLHSAKLVGDISYLDPMTNGSYMRTGVTNIEVVKLETVATIVSPEEIESVARAKLLKELAELEGKVREKTAALGKLK